MFIYGTIRNLSALVDDLRVVFFQLYASTRGVYLVGQYLSAFFLSVSNYLLMLESRLVDLSVDWDDFYGWVQQNLGLSNIPVLLLQYADDLIHFIQSPYYYISEAIRHYMPQLNEIIHDPISFVLEIIYNYTGLDIDFVDNPRAVIRNIASELLGEVIDIARNPEAWLLDKLTALFPDFWRIIADARGWVADRIQEEFPNVVNFLRDPDGYIEDKLLHFLEGFTERYLDKVLSITEKILDIIF